MQALFFLPRQESAKGGPDEENRGRPDKDPLARVERHADDGGLRAAVVPAQVRAFEHGTEEHENCEQRRAQPEQRPVQDFPPRAFPANFPLRRGVGALCPACLQFAHILFTAAAETNPIIKRMTI